MSRRVKWNRKLPCPRCGGDCPRRAKLVEFTVPDDTPSFLATHWSLCEALGEPILYGNHRTPPPNYLIHGVTTTGSSGIINISVLGN